MKLTLKDVGFDEFDLLKMNKNLVNEEFCKKFNNNEAFQIFNITRGIHDAYITISVYDRQERISFTDVCSIYGHTKKSILLPSGWFRKLTDTEMSIHKRNRKLKDLGIV